MPTTSVPAGAQYTIINNSTGLVTVQSSGAATILTMVAGTSAIFTAVIATPTTAANWNSQYIGVSISTGKRLAVSNTLTLAGTDNTTMTFPSTSDTVVTLGATQTLTAKTLTLPTINGYNEGTTTATVTTSYTFSLASTTQFILTLTANTTCNCTMPAASSGGSFTVQVKQPVATGNGGITFLNTKWPTAGMPALTSAAGKMDIFSFVSDGTSWFGSYVQGYTY